MSRAAHATIASGLIVVEDRLHTVYNDFEIVAANLLENDSRRGNDRRRPTADRMYARAPYTMMQRAMHIHPTVSERLSTMLEELKPL